MSKFVISIEREADFNKVLENIKKVSANIVVLDSGPSKMSKLISGYVIIECSDELAEKVKAVQGIRCFELEIIHHAI